MLESLWLSGLIFVNLWTASGAAASSRVRPPTPDTVESRVNEATVQRPLVLGSIDSPLKPGERVWCEIPPGNHVILQAMSPVERGVPFISEVFRDDIEIAVENVVDRLDPPRSFPLVGMAQLKHCQWKCTVHFTEHIEIFYPIPLKTQRKRTEIVYIDRDYLYPFAVQEKQADISRTKSKPTTPPNLNTRSGKLHVVLNAGDGERITILPATGKESVLDVIAQIKEYPAGKKIQKIWVRRPASEEHNDILLDVDWNGIIQAGRTETNFQLLAGDRVYVTLGSAVAQAQHFEKATPAEITIDDVVKMTRLGISQAIIVRQIELENAMFNLSAADIIHLHQAGASEGLIRIMQERCTRIFQTAEPEVIQASAVEERIVAATPNQMNVKEIVRLKEVGTPDVSVIQLFEVTRSVFRLNGEDVRFLRQYGVSDAVINAMRLTSK